MKQTKIYLTNISCHKMQNIVGQGCSSAYQVLISESDYVGIAGQVSDPANSQASNENFPVPASAAQYPWLQRVLRSLGLKKD